MFVDCAQAKDLVDNNTVVVVVDTNKPSYTECQDLLYLTRTIVVLDHHRRGSEVIQNAVLSYVEPYASSTCEMVAEILQYFDEDLRLRSLEADCLYAGMVIDTNNLLHAPACVLRSSCLSSEKWRRYYKSPQNASG